MVNPPNNSSSKASPAALGDIRLDASSSETLRYLSTRVGELVEARVLKVSAIVDAEIAKANSRLIPTGTGQNSSQAAKGYDVLLNVGGQQLAVKSELAPRLGQILQLEVQSSQQLRIVDLGRPVPPQNTAISNAQNPTQTTSAVGNPGLANTGQTASSATLAADALLASRLGNSRSTALPTQLQQQAEQTLLLLQSGLRDTLPKQTPRELLLADLQRLSTPARAGQISTAQTSTTSTQNSAGIASANRQLQNALIRLGKSVSPLNALVQPDGLKQAVQNSGVFYENKIATLLSAQSANAQPTTPTPANPQSAANSAASTAEQNQYMLRQLSQGPTAALQARAATSGLPAISAAPLPLAESATLQGLAAKTATTAVGRDSNANIDNKLALLGLLGSIKNSLAVTGRAGADTKTNALTADNSNLAALWQFIPSQASVLAPAGNIDAGKTDDGLLQLLRMALGVVARTQSHQLLAVNTQLAAANADSNISQSLTMELPLWVEQKINLVDLRVDAEKPQRKSGSSQDKVWNARQQFDLDQYGQLVALATLRAKTVAAVLWASESATADKISKELTEVAENFDRLGLTVQNLQCRVGEPEKLKGNETINLLDTEI